MIDALAILGRAHDRFDTSGGTATLDDMLAGSELVTVAVDDQDVGAFALCVVEQGDQRVAWVTIAAGGHPGVDLTRAAMPQIEAKARARGATQLAISTRRRGLVRKLESVGFKVNAITLRKNLA